MITANVTTVVGALLFVVFAPGHWKRHRIGVLRAILLPASANMPLFVLNHLLQTHRPDFRRWCNPLQTSRTTGTAAEQDRSCQPAQPALRFRFFACYGTMRTLG
jgi:hypothetical protein